MLQAHVVVNGWTSIGEDCQIYPFATIGAASQDRKYSGERAFTRVGNRTVLREYVSIQRATGHDEVTAVGNDCLLLAYVHVAHNCVLGDGVTMSNLAQLAGHVDVGDYATIGGQAGVHQFTRIGRYAMIGGATKLTKDVPPFFLDRRQSGAPVRPQQRRLAPRRVYRPKSATKSREFYKILYDPETQRLQSARRDEGRSRDRSRPRNRRVLSEGRAARETRRILKKTR